MSEAKILFPTDFSESSAAAIPHATALARERGADLIIVHVTEPPGALAAAGGFAGAVDPHPEYDEQELKKVAPVDSHVAYEHRLVRGQPAEEIVQLAADEDVDLIVMATHGRTGLGHLLMGSVAEAVVRTAPCPVLTFRRPEKTECKQD